ncbi:MAG: D-aminoacyl-tRNA deacylase [Capsulimonadaceae bacterium]
MRAVVQRTTAASVTLRETGERRAIDAGLVVLIGIGHDDTVEDADYLADKIVGLRIFNDSDGKMNRGLLELPAPGVLIVSQFTLMGDTRKGRRPSFIAAGRPEQAIPLYERFVDTVRRLVPRVETGEFGASMLVEIANDGPVTLIIDSPPAAG